MSATHWSWADGVSPSAEARPMRTAAAKDSMNLFDISFFIILGSLFSTVTLADHGFVGHSWSSMFRFIARNIGGEPAANFGRRRGFWLAGSDL